MVNLKKYIMAGSAALAIANCSFCSNEGINLESGAKTEQGRCLKPREFYQSVKEGDRVCLDGELNAMSGIRDPYNPEVYIRDNNGEIVGVSIDITVYDMLRDMMAKHIAKVPGSASPLKRQVRVTGTVYSDERFDKRRLRVGNSSLEFLADLAEKQ